MIQKEKQRIQTAWAIAFAYAVCGFSFGSGCAGEPETELLSIGSSSQALTAGQSRVLGFETPTADWSTTNSGATLSQSSVASQGSAALGVLPNGWTEINSIQLSSLGTAKNTATVDVRLPAAVTWGEVRMVLIMPSQGMSWKELGSQNLSGLTANAYHSLSFPIDSGTMSNLSGTYGDLTIKVVVNAPRLSSPYVLDNIVIADSNSIPDTDSENADTDQTCSIDSNAQILDFEDSAYWTPSRGTVQTSTLHEHGTNGIAVSGGGWIELQSAPLSTLDSVDSTLVVSMRLPVIQPNPSWYGQVQLYIDLPSQNIYNQWIEQKALTGLPLGKFVSLEFTLPQNVVSALKQDYCDLRLKLALNVPNNATGRYIFDALRFEDLNVPPRILLASSDQRTLSESKNSFAVVGNSFDLLGQIMDDGGVVSASIRLNDAPETVINLDSNGMFEQILDLPHDPNEFITLNTILIKAVDVDGNTAMRTISVETMSIRVPGEVVVLFRAEADDALRQASLDKVAGSVKSSISDHVKLIQVPPNTELQATQTLLSEEDVRAAMPNFPLTLARIPNDAGFGSQWDLERIEAPEAWDVVWGAEDIVVAVIDSGVSIDDDAIFFSYPCDVINNTNTIDWSKPIMSNVWLNEKECCSTPPCESTCRPGLPADDPNTCPIADLNDDGCPGVCGLDDDSDGQLDFNDPDVKRIYTNGRDDDGDGLIDEQGPGGVSCALVTPSQMQNTTSTEDCDGAANDDDENGYPDDCRGFQFGRLQGMLEDYFGNPVRPNNSTDLEGGNDGQGTIAVGHGTLVAETLGEIGDNCFWYVGVAPRVRIMPLGIGRYIWTEGTRSLYPMPDFLSILEAYEYAAENGAMISNASLEAPCNCLPVGDPDCIEECPWGNELSADEARDQMTLFMSETSSQHMLHVVAAGNAPAGGEGLNYDVDTNPIFPQHVELPNIMMVAASNSADNRADFSNYGGNVSMAAPGDGTPILDGTSGAAPHVAGAAALLLEAMPKLQGAPDQAMRLMEETATKLPQWNGVVRAGGILNVNTAIHGTVPPPKMFSDVSYKWLSRGGRDLQTNDVDLLDVDGDGDLDLLEMPCSPQGDMFPARLLINESGKFHDRSLTQWPQTPVSNCDADFGDVDGDGDVDVLAAGYHTDPNSQANQNQVYINNGGGIFTNETLARLPIDLAMTRALSLCDIDSDGDLDLFTANLKPDVDPTHVVNRVFINNGIGVFTEETAIRMLNVNRPEIGAPSKVICAELTQPLNNICDRSQESCRLCSDPNLAFSDIQARGVIFDIEQCRIIRQMVTPDVVVANSQGTITRLFNNQGGGIFAEATDDLSLPTLDYGRQEMDVEAADFDNDNDIDLMFVTGRGSRNFVLLNNGSGVFFEGPAQPMTSVGDWAREVEAADFDMDGDVDIVVFRGNPKEAKAGFHSYYRNDGFGMFTELDAGIVSQFLLTADGDTGDIDSDGDIDLVIGNHGAMNQVLVNNTISL